MVASDPDLAARGQALQFTPSAPGSWPNTQNAECFTTFDLNAVLNKNTQMEKI